ncbi:SusC/RagA family TonB-linked outer membrane protein [Algibacter sp. Ld11]|uniref:SusC/RagA family TonB-linked outer membrane protein n=1 Tax=Algibacter sp. Ld11 TaxID=649150 RepID=UPI00386ED01B
MKKLYLFIITILISVIGYGQATVTGTVVGVDGMPIPGASIIANGNTLSGVATDFDGKFIIETNEIEGVLKVSSMTYESKEVNYKGNQALNIILKESASLLDEVVLIGYGSTKKGDLTSAISKVENIESIASRPVSNLTDFIQGNVPGVTVLQSGGDPSSSGKVVIRGLGSVNSGSESVLTVVDGVPYYGPAINPNDIASVSVLKDAAAASIYGALASSGVIVIQTKKGKKGKPRVSIDTYTGIRSATNLPTALNAKQQADVYNMATDAAGAPRQSAHDAAQNPWGQVTRTNWVDTIFRDASTTNLNANISGAGDSFNYLTSFGYNSTEGVLKGTDSERYSFRVKSDFDLTDKITIGENVYFSEYEALGTDTKNGYSGTIINAIYMPSAAPAYDEFGEFHGVAPYSLSQFAGAYGDVYNPLALLLRPVNERPSTYINANVYLDYEIVKGLNFKTTYSYASTNSNSKSFNPRRPELGRTSLSNSLVQSESETNRWVWDNQISYVKSFGKNNLNLTAIYSAQLEKFESLSQRGEEFSNEAPFNQYLGNATIFKTPISSAYEEALTSSIGRVMYNYDSKYFVSGSVRRDETSRLFIENQSDVFYSATLGWKISNEDFFKSDLIDDLKIRASWGQIGNVNSVNRYSFNVPLRSNTVLLGDGATDNNRALYQEIQSNEGLGWERSESIDFGLDASLLNNSLSFVIDYFEKRTKDMILNGDGDDHLGITAGKVNGGEVINKGLEFAINYSNNIGDLNFRVSANAFSLLENKLLNLKGFSESGTAFVLHDEEEVRGGVLRPYRSGVGEELFSYFLIPYQSIFQNQAEIDAYTKDGNLIQPEAVPGDFKFEDTNNDGRIDGNDRKYMGSYQPDFTYSFGLNLDYKAFDMSMILQGVSGAEAFNGYKYTTYNTALQGYNLDSRVLNAWTPTNTNTDIPRISRSDNNNNFGRNSSWYLEDASYLRLKNVTIGYNLPVKTMDKFIEGSSLRVYFSAENLFTITDYSGIDPEVGGKGLDVANYPLSRTLTAGLSLKL